MRSELDLILFSPKFPLIPLIVIALNEVREAFIVNVIAPILPILNAFLSENHRQRLQAQLFSEVQKSETGRRALKTLDSER